MNKFVVGLIMLFSFGCLEEAPTFESMGIEPATQEEVVIDEHNVGGIFPLGYGLTASDGGTMIPNDRVHSINFIPEGFDDSELSAMKNMLDNVAKLSSFEVIEGDEVTVVADTKEASDACKGIGDKTCWFASAHCDSVTRISDEIIICNKYHINISINNIRAVAVRFNIPSYQPLKTTLTHEILHTMGLRHSSAGVMRASIPASMLKDAGKIEIQQCETNRLNAFETDDSGVWNSMNVCE